MTKYWYFWTKENMPAAKFAYEVCGRIFSLDYQICFDISDLHMDQTPFLCQTCWKPFNRRKSYLRHTGNHQETSDKKSYDSKTMDDSKNCDSGEKRKCLF